MSYTQKEKGRAHTRNSSAPGEPGMHARWTSSAKIGVGTALSSKSRVWFTLGHGIFNEIYYPRIDQACIRDMGLIVTDGASFFDGTGIGRGWPLLTGERAHYEMAADRVRDAKRLLAAMESFANEDGLIPEQVWDSPDIPGRELCFGRPSGSTMPLVWAHAEYLKLRRSLRDGRIFDLPPQTVQRYLTEKTDSPPLVWRFNHKIRSLPPGKMPRLETPAPAVILWSADDWKTVQDATTHDVGLGLHLADLSTESLPEGRQIKFTFYWLDAGHWEGKDFIVRVAAWHRDGTAPAERSGANGK